MMSIYAAILGWWRCLRKKLASRVMIGGIMVLTTLVVYFRSHDHVGSPRPRLAPQVGHTQKVKMSQDTFVSINSTFFNLTHIHIEHMLRLKHIQNICQGQDGDMFGLSSNKWAYGRIEIDREENYLYCPLLKAGSTFFRRIFYTTREKHHLSNPYKVPIQKALMAKRNVLEDILPLTSPSTAAFLANSTAIMFVRDPFSRLLSGYVDKLFAPNPYFWSQIGKYIVPNFRLYRTSKSLRCGHDVTFGEFVRYVLNSEATNSSHRDAHFTPSYDQCKPCHLNYTVLGKMETFQADIAYTLSQLGHNVSKEDLATWARDSAYDAIMDSTVSPFSWRTAVKKCMTWHEALVRVWRKMQIRGIILFEDKFPWLPEYTEKFVAFKTFTNMVKKLHLKSEKNKLKQQKIEVLAEAYSQVPASDLQKLVEVFRLDFELFQYDPYPNYIFDENFVTPFRIRNFIFNLSTV